jgi:probable rRNA maturation factor
MSQLRISISNRYPALLRPESATRRMLRQLHFSRSFPISSGDLSIAFVDDAAIAKLHSDFMQDPSATDVITFPADADLDFAGEIIVSVDRALDHAIKNSVPFNCELALYLIHGWLHLAGFNDHTSAESKIMRDAENKALACVADLIPNFRLR